MHWFASSLHLAPLTSGPPLIGLAALVARIRMRSRDVARSTNALAMELRNLGRQKNLHYEDAYCSLTGAVGIDPIRGLVAFCSQASVAVLDPLQIHEITLIEKAAPKRARGREQEIVDYFLIIRVSGHEEQELCLHSPGKQGPLPSIGEKLRFFSQTAGRPVVARQFRITSEGDVRGD